MHHCSRKKTTTAITQCKLQYYIHHMHVHTTTTITTAQLRDNACIQHMRHCFGKKTTSTSISHSACYNITSNHHHYHHHDHHSTNYNASIQYMCHCLRKNTTTTAITQCKLQYYGQPPLPPPPPPGPPQHKLQCMHSVYVPLL